MSKDGLAVMVWTDSQESEIGILNIKDNDIIITLESGNVVAGSESTNVLYSFIDDLDSSHFRIRLNPFLLRTHFYAADIGQVVEDIFPPSSGGFYGRMRAGRAKAVFVVQEIQNSPRFWLIIGNPQTGRIYETQVIQAYEVETLKLYDDQEIVDLWDTDVLSGKEEILKQRIEHILDEPSPPWDSISKLVEEVALTNLRRGKTVRDSFSQLVPESFPKSIREQLMAFLAIVIMDRIDMEEIIDFSSYIYASPMIRGLILGHLRCKIDNVKWPPYVEIILQSSKGHMEQPRRTLPDLADDSWRLLSGRIKESFPDWFGDAIDSVIKLEDSKKFHPRLPVTKSQAIKSKRLWKKRLAAFTYGLKIRGHVNPNTIGLVELMYLGAAYRWPHRHMKFITRLGVISENPPHLQIMALPLSSVERVMRVLPQCIEITWSKRVVNLGLYRKSSKKWEIPVERILSSINDPISRRKMQQRFGNELSQDTHHINTDEAQVLGLISGGIYLDYFERPEYFRYWGLDSKKVSSHIKRLLKRNILQISYEVEDPRLVSLASIIQGRSEDVTSFVDSLLTYSPTSLAMLNREFDRGVVISKFPEDIVYDLASKLEQYDVQKNLVIRCLRPQTFRSFASTLYHRLLKPDGTWDDDVSAFLSQARSKRRELSESNA